jgi:acetyltransferase-like isoleucine patch superfamily enzyme
MPWRKLLDDPLSYFWLPTYIVARARGIAYRLRYLASSRVRIDPGFVAESPLVIRGSGSVHIGRGVKVRRSNTYLVSIRTLAPEARVTIGDGSELGGVQILCRREVTLGEKTLAANCRIQDVDFVAPERDGAPEPVRLGKGVWVGLTSLLLKRATVGDWAIVAAGSVVERAIDSLAVAMGNPARPIRGVVVAR